MPTASVTPGRIQCVALKRGYGSKAKFVVPCAEPDCTNIDHVEAGSEQQIPTIIRRRGWSVTGRANHTRWWCGTHRQENSR